MVSQTTGPSTKQVPSWYWVIAVILAGSLLWLVIRQIDWQLTLQTLSLCRPTWLLAAALLLNGGYLLRSLRWRLLLNSRQTVTPGQVYGATLAGYLGNNFLPARSGELVRTVLLSHSAALNVSFVLGTIVTERAIDMIAVVVLGSSLLLWLPEMNTSLPSAWSAGLRLTAIVAALLAGVLIFSNRTQLWVQRWLARAPLPPPLSPRLDTIVNNLGEGLQSCRHLHRALALIALTVIIWLNDAAAARATAQSLNLPLSLEQALFFLIALALSSAAPSTPGYLGIYQFVAVTLLPLFGLSSSQALAYVIAFQATAYVVVIIGGIWGIWYLRRPRRQRLSPPSSEE